MTDAINLNNFRKERQRADKKRQSDENARKFGRSKAERLLEAARTEKARQMLDRHRLDDQD
jgi:hypothetical protein